MEHTSSSSPLRPSRSAAVTAGEACRLLGAVSTAISPPSLVNRVRSARPSHPAGDHVTDKFDTPRRYNSARSDIRDYQYDIARKIRARVEHTLARMKVFKILRDYRRAAHTLGDTASAIANLHNIILTG